MDSSRYTGRAYSGGIFYPVYVDQNTAVEVKPPPSGWTYLFVQNQSSGDIYYSEGTQATSDNGIVLSTGQWLELSSNLGNALPNGNIWLKGSSASRQRVQIKGG